MSNVVIDKLEELAPGYALTSTQRRRIDLMVKTGKADQAARLLPALLDDLKDEIIKGLDGQHGIAKEDIENVDVVEAITFSHPTSGYGSNDPLHVLKDMSADTMMKVMGRAMLRQLTVHCHTFADVVDAYRQVFGRLADPLGMSFWTQHRIDGMSKAELIGHLEDSEEAQG